VLVHVKDGKAIKVEGDPEGPLNKGTLCSKGLASIELLYHPDRIKYPMRRVGRRGEGKWQRISWDEALDTVTKNLKEIKDRYGPLAVAYCSGTYRWPSPYFYRFVAASGTPNLVMPAHICYTQRIVTTLLTFGRVTSHDPENSNCIVAWGTNVTHTNAGSYNASKFINGWKKGAKLICVDPVFSPIASKADLWLQVRPGTDCALALAWLNIIISEGLYDKEFIDKWTYGFDRLVEHIKKFTPEWAEQITWVPAGKIRQAARIYATSKPACIFIGNPLEFGVNVTNQLRALYLLPAVTGNVDIPGGNVFWESPLPDYKKIYGTDLLPKDAWEKRIARYPLISLRFPAVAHDILRAAVTEKPYPIKAIICHATNPILAYENAKGLMYQALTKVEFLEVMDQFMTPTAELADIVLPAATWLEKDDIIALCSELDMEGYVLAAQKVVEPLWESRDDKEVFIELSKRLGLNYGFDNATQMLDSIVEPLGMTFDEFKEKGWATQTQKYQKYKLGLLRPDGTPGFNTPSGKIELYSEQLEEMGLDPLPIPVEPPESPVSSPKLAKEYPLVLTTGFRSPVFFHSQNRQIPWLREIHPDPIVRIHPETARGLGISDGDWVYIESPRARCKQRAKLTLGIDPRVVMAEHDWWFPEKPGAEPELHGVWESNINVVTDAEPPYDPGFGSTPARSLLCKIYKVEA
jgi:anaerobic selenocysteine-containing dehydrogenase